MPLDVLQQVVRPHERAAAGGAHELLLAGVRTLVPGQLVTAREDLVAVFVRTVEWLLSWKCISIMCLIGSLDLSLSYWILDMSISVCKPDLPVWTLK